MTNEKNDEIKIEKSLTRLKKQFAALFVAYLIVLVFWYSIKTDPAANRTIFEKVGALSSGVSVSIKEALTIKELSVNLLKDYLKKGDYELAYERLISKEYKQYFSFEDFLHNVQDIDPDSIDMKNIKSRTNISYDAEVRYQIDGQDFEKTYVIFVDEFNPMHYTMSLDNFLYSYKNVDFKDGRVNLHIDECVVYTDEIYLKGTISNKPFFNKNLIITDIAVTYDTTLSKSKEFPYELAKDQSHEFMLKFDNTKFFIPNGIAITVQEGKKLKKYTFKFTENEEKT